MRNWLFFLMFSFVFLSCKKEYHVVGRVYNPITGEGMAGVKVEFTRSMIGELPGGFTEVASTSSDADGFYELKYKGIAERVQPEPYNLYLLGTMEEGKYQQVTILDHTKIQWVDWHIVPYGQIITHTENINCAGPTDSMQVRGKTDYTPWTSFGYIYRTGCYNHTSSSPSKVPMGYRYYETKVTRSGVTTYIYDTVFVNETGTTFLEILY